MTNALNSDTLTPHRTVVPLFSDVAGTVRVDCTVPEVVFLATYTVIPRDDMVEWPGASPSTSHTR